MSGAKIGFMTFLRDKSGNVLPLAALGMVLSAALVGGGIDMSRAYRVENRLQSSCDSAVLAGRRAVDSSGYTPAAKAQAKSYFDTNFDDAYMETQTTTFDSSSDDNGQTVKGTASTSLNLAVMKIFGFPKFSLSVECQATMGVGNSDVVMVLDTTGSMATALGGGTRMSALKSAMKNFYTTVKNATASSNARVRYGFVPFSSSVNVGGLLYAKNPAYLRDTWDIQSRKPVENGTASSPVDKNLTDGTYNNDTSTSYGSKNDCQSGQQPSSAWANSGSSYQSSVTNKEDHGYGYQTWTKVTRQPQQRTVNECYKSGGNWYRRSYQQTKELETTQGYKWAYTQVSYDVSSYKAFQSVSTNTDSYGGAETSTWEGCIEERDTTASSSFSYSTTSGITPYAADLDIDSAPTNDDTKWAPMWPEVAYHRYDNSASSDYGYAVGSYCPHAARLMATMDQSAFNAYADALYPEGSTYLDIGMVWGGRLSSPDGIFQDNVKLTPSNGGEVSRHIIFMTDGIMEPNNDIQSAWGIEYHDRRVTSDGSSNHASRHSSRFLAICESIKAKGIRIWAISFTSGTSSSLQTCASAQSYYNANNSTELDEAFQEIAKQVGELRISK